jgi:hypothetical protein
MRKASVTAAIVTCAALAITLVAAGCGGSSSPDTAVSNFFQAISQGNYNAFASAVLPERVKAMTDTESKSLQDQIKKKSEKYSGMKFKVVYDKNDKNKAKVVVLSGKITAQNPTTGKNETMDIKSVPESARTLNVVKYKGSWYLDIPLSSSQAQPQSATQSSQ